MYFIHKAVPTSLTSQDFAIACAKEVADMSMDTFNKHLLGRTRESAILLIEDDILNILAETELTSHLTIKERAIQVNRVTNRIKRSVLPALYKAAHDYNQFIPWVDITSMTEFSRILDKVNQGIAEVTESTFLRSVELDWEEIEAISGVPVTNRDTTALLERFREYEARRKLSEIKIALVNGVRHLVRDNQIIRFPEHIKIARNHPFGYNICYHNDKQYKVFAQRHELFRKYKELLWKIDDEFNIYDTPILAGTISRRVKYDGLDLPMFIRIRENKGVQNIVLYDPHRKTVVRVLGKKELAKGIRDPDNLRKMAEASARIYSTIEHTRVEVSDILKSKRTLTESDVLTDIKLILSPGEIKHV